MFLPIYAKILLSLIGKDSLLTTELSRHNVIIRENKSKGIYIYNLFCKGRIKLQIQYTSPTSITRISEFDEKGIITYLYIFPNLGRRNIYYVRPEDNRLYLERDYYPDGLIRDRYI